MKRGGNGGAFFGYESELSVELGTEDAAALLRARRLHSPRELTAGERAELWASLEPVLRDLRASEAIVPDVREQSWDDDEDSVCAYVGSGGAGTMGVRVRLGYGPAERLADLADQVQEWEVEELAAVGRPATWPQCPAHPNSHPLSAEERDGEAVWCCPRSGGAIFRIGALG